MKNLVERLLSVVLVAAAVAVASAEIHREFWPSTNRPRSEYVSNWQPILKFAHIIGDSTAPITVVEFADFQCPYCKRFSSVVDSLRAKYPHDVRVAFVHFPLPGHLQAEPAARAAECIGAARPFDAAVSALYAKQDSLGKIPWSVYARDAGLQDTIAFARCNVGGPTPTLVDAGRQIGDKLNVRATPTILLNGWRYGGVPSDTELVRAVGDILSGKSPYKGFPKKAVRRVASAN